MVDTSLYLVTRDIAIRSGVANKRYRVPDGRFVLDNKDLSRIRFTTDEYVSGLKGVEKISDTEAATLIARQGYQMGLNENYVEDEQQSNEESVVVEDEKEETTNDNEEKEE